MLNKVLLIMLLAVVLLPLAGAELPPRPGDAAGLLAAESANLPGIALDKVKMTLPVGETARLVATLVNAAGAAVAWSSSNPGFATVDKTGLVTALHEGSLTIAAQLEGDIIVAECRLEVVAAAGTGAGTTAAAEPLPPRTITGIVIADEAKIMFVGEEYGIIAHALPYNVFADNPYTLETSAPEIVQVDNANMVRAIAPGMATVTARTPDGLTDSINVEVRPAPGKTLISAAETYQVEPTRFGIVQGAVEAAQAQANTLGINQVLLYAQRWGYKQVVFPPGLYLLDPAESISMRSNLAVDLNGATWQVMPNAYPRYTLVRFQEMDWPNQFPGYEIETDSALCPGLATTPLNTFKLPEGRSLVRSLPIPAGALPERHASLQVPDKLVRGYDYRFSSPLGIRRGKSEIEPDKTGRIEVRLLLGYYQGDRQVTAQELGKYWLRSLDAKLWCDIAATTRQLRATADYDNVRLKLRFELTDCTAEIFFARPVVSRAVAAVLENSSLRNGTILGERDFKEQHFPGWQQDGKTEGALAISFDEGHNNGIEKLNVRKSPGFNIAARLGNDAHGAVRIGTIPVKYTNLEPGGLAPDGAPRSTAHTQRTVDFIDITALNDTYEFGNPLGYMGYNILRARIYDIYFYDADKQFLERGRGRLTFRKYSKPQNAKFAKLVLHWDLEMPISRGLRDFQDAIGFITDFRPPTRNYIRDCVIEDNYSCGMAVCGGINWLIEGNIFRRNGGRMPGCDIVWEDGWEYSQDDVVRDNTFESRSSVILCSGINHVFRNNIIYGNMIAYGRTQHLRISGNTFTAGNGNHSLGTQTNIYTCGNTFQGGTVKLTRQHGAQGRYNGAWHENIFVNTSLLEAATAGNMIIGNSFIADAGSRPKVMPGAVNTKFSGSFILGGDSYSDCEFSDGVLAADRDRQGNPIIIQNSRLLNVSFDKPENNFLQRGNKPASQ